MQETRSGIASVTKLHRHQCQHKANQSLKIKLLNQIRSNKKKYKVPTREKRSSEKSPSGFDSLISYLPKRWHMGLWRGGNHQQQEMKKQIAQRLRVLTRPQTGLNKWMICRCLHMPLPGIRFRFRKDQSWLQIDGRMQPEGCNGCRSKPPFCRDGSYWVSEKAL